MKKVLMIVISCLALNGWATDAQKRFERAEKLFTSGKYKEALDIYTTLEKENLTGKELYYNIGNCFYKTGSLGYAIAYYEKAMKLDPSDEDTRANLKLANSKIRDEINEEEKGLAGWFNRFIYIFITDRWTLYGLLLWFVAFAGFILASTRWVVRKQMMKISSWVMLSLASVLLVLGFIHYTRDINTNKVVIVESVVQVKAAPSDTAKNLYTLNEGSKVTLRNANDNWLEISVDNENYGWIRKTDAVKI